MFQPAQQKPGCAIAKSASTSQSIRRLLSASALILLAVGAQFQAAAHPKPDVRTGIYHGRSITYQVINGFAVLEGDIIVGRVEEVAAETSGLNARISSPHPDAYSITPTPSTLWPKVGNVYQVPYTIATANAVAEQSVVQFNTIMQGVIQYVKRTTEPDYVVFNLDTNGCSSQSYVGRIGGAQQISGSASGDCVLVIMHEMGHSIGLFHEQSRTDRDNFVQIFWSNIAPKYTSEFYGEKSALNLGYYDIGSAMHYSDTLFALDNTDATIASLPVGIPFKDGGGYSAGDLDAIRRLYNAVPAQVTITTVPPGLQFTVDDQIVTSGTPGAAFTWALNSIHTIDVPANLQTQTLNGATYVFGRWNDIPVDQTIRHTITVTPGDGTYSHPVTAPQYTAYSASFRLLVPAAGAFTTSVSPAAAGSVTAGPDPVNVQGTNYYYAFQPLNLTAAPAAGYNFYDWQFDGASPVISGANPRILRANLNKNVTARFAQNPVTGFATFPPSLPVTVDGVQVYAPKNFAQDYDAAWTQGSTHTVAVDSPLPSNLADSKARLAFANWSDGGAQTHNVTAGANAMVTANFTVQFPLLISQAGVLQGITAANCAATFASNPASTDTFYNVGTSVAVTAQPNAGWNFIGWQGDLNGNANPGTVTMNSTKNVNAVFNTAPSTDPLTVTGLAPSTGLLNGPAVAVTINGTGFTPQTQVCFIPANGAGPCVDTTYVAPNQIQAQVTADLLTTAQTYTVSISNSPDGQCSVNVTAPFAVQDPATARRR